MISINKKINKKAIIFTFIAILIASLLTTIYATYQITPLDHSVKFDKARVRAMNDHLSSLIDFAHVSLLMSGYRALQGMIEHVRTDGFFLHEPDIKNSFIECITNASLKGGQCPYMENATITHLLEVGQNLSRDEFGYNSTIFKVESITVNQVKPFAVTVNMTLIVYLSNEDVVWNTTQVISEDISINGLQDPVYFHLPYQNKFLESRTIPENFNSSSFTKFVEDGEYVNSITGLEFHTFGAEYKPKSFFGRLANSTSVANDPELTIISVVDPQKVIAAGSTPYTNSSYVDFLYNKRLSDCDTLRTVINDTSGARIDRFHATQTFTFSGSELNQAFC